MPKQSLIEQMVRLESSIATTQRAMYDAAKTQNTTALNSLRDIMEDETRELVRLRERQAELSGRDLAKAVFRQLKAMANAHRPSARAIAAEPQTEDANEKRESENARWN